MRYILVFSLLGVVSCGGMPPMGDCGAENYQDLVGKSAIEYLKVIPEAEPWVKNNTYYVGKKEDLSEADFANHSVIVELNKNQVNKEEDLMSARITKIYCYDKSAQKEESD